MKTQIRLSVLLVVIGLISCEKYDSLNKEVTYLDYLKDKAIVSIHIQGDTKYIFTSIPCDTCYVAPHLSHLPTIEEWTVISDSTYMNYSLTEFSGLPVYDNHRNKYVMIENTLYKIQDNGEQVRILSKNDYAFTSFTFDNQNNIWFYGHNIGIAFWDKSSLTIYNEANSQLPTDRVHGLKVDKAGVIWISLDFKGLLKMENETWAIIPNKEIPGLSEYSYLRGPKIIQQNSVWFEVFSPDTSSNILRLENGKWIYEFPTNNKYGDLIIDSEGTIWAIYSHYDYSYYSKSTLKYYKNNSWIDFDIRDINSRILTINADENTVYIGTIDGLIEKPR